MKTLDPKIVDKLSKELGVSPKTIRNRISLLAQVYPGASPNALAHIYAQQNGKSVLNNLTKEDRQSFPSVKVPIITTPVTQRELRVIKIGNDENSFLNNPLVQLIVGFFLVGIVAGTISQVLGAYVLRWLGF